MLAACALYALRGSSAGRRGRVVPARGERVLIIGATSGIGRELAAQYARRGARVMLTGRRAKELDEAAAECVAEGAATAVRTART